MPKVRQVLVADDAAVRCELDPMERRLYLARKQFERAVELGEVTGYVCSLSAQTIVYKAMCLGRLLPEFYPDLAIGGVCDAVCDLSSAVCDEHAADVASRAAFKEAGA